MALEVIREAPSGDTFTPLSAHESQTPDSFYSGKPVLHYESHNAHAVVSKNTLDSFPLFSSLSGSVDASNSAGINGHRSGVAESADPSEQVVVSGIDVWVTSTCVCVSPLSGPIAIFCAAADYMRSRLILYNASQSSGVSIPYPAITLHAIQRLQLPNSPPDSAHEDQGIYMQILSSSGNDAEYNDDDDDDGESDTLEITVIPSPSSSSSPPARPDSSPDTTPIQVFFAAVSTCSNMHPDPLNPSSTSSPSSASANPILFEGSVGYDSGIILPGNNSGDGGLPPAFPGSGGWITGENVGDYFDEEGNWKEGGGGGSGVGGEEEEEDGVPGLTVLGDAAGLGPGAGSVRPREPSEGKEEEMVDGASETNGVTEDTDGVEETKWRRTG
ncbi:MAG: hypothetical protein M1837_006445 [Sclerophora amabilis]|nr:MAG: hypothetical protein M1837_006445 [Sclerophora amabilis]